MNEAAFSARWIHARALGLLWVWTGSRFTLAHWSFSSDGLEQKVVCFWTFSRQKEMISLLYIMTGWLCYRLPSITAHTVRTCMQEKKTPRRAPTVDLNIHFCTNAEKLCISRCTAVHWHRAQLKCSTNYHLSICEKVICMLSTVVFFNCK